MNTLTLDEVRKIADGQARGPFSGSPGFNVKAATRTAVHEALQAKNPPPCATVAPEHAQALNGRRPLTFTEKAAIDAFKRGQVTEEHHQSLAAARSAGSLDAVGVIDTFHFVQKMHGKSLWEETDRLVAALGEVKS